MLPERQQNVLDFLTEFQRAEGTPPSSRDIAKRFKFSQPAAIGHLQALARKGHVKKLPDGRWGLKGPLSEFEFVEVPVYGAIPAGLPAMQQQEIEETIRIDPAIFGITKAQPHHFWFLRVMGDSMDGTNILNGDLVALVRREPRSGDIIAALVNETETTLKRLVNERGRVLLRAANKRYKDIHPQKLESQGVVVGVLRRKIAA